MILSCVLVIAGIFYCATGRSLVDLFALFPWPWYYTVGGVGVLVLSGLLDIWVIAQGAVRGWGLR